MLDSRPNGAQPTCFIHIGTHKTGTTSVQRSLAANEVALRTAGIHVPVAGRGHDRAGHHNLAWELAGDRRFTTANGRLADVVDEVARVGAPTVALSSEDFEYLALMPAALRRIRTGFEQIGYRPVIVAYLRPQASYAESLYAELVRHGFSETFDDFLTAILADGTIEFGDWRFTFDYERLLDGFAAVFGRSALIVRPYTNDIAGRVTADFLRTIGVPADASFARTFARTKRLNPSLPFIDVMRTYRANVGAATATQLAALPAKRAYRQRFDPVRLPEIGRIGERFAAGNQRLYERYGVALPFVSRRDLWADVAASLGFGPGTQARRELLGTQRPSGAPAKAT